MNIPYEQYLLEVCKTKGIQFKEKNELFEFDLRNVFKAKLDEKIEEQMNAGVFCLLVNVYTLAEESIAHCKDLILACEKIENS